jgi:hypothetical protein
MKNELYHHGIKGQKWGVRRFQNENGSYTDEGKKRYGIDSPSDERRQSSLKKNRKETIKSIAIGAAFVGGTALATYGYIKYIDSFRNHTNASAKTGKRIVDSYLNSKEYLSRVIRKPVYNKIRREENAKWADKMLKNAGISFDDPVKKTNSPKTQIEKVNIVNANTGKVKVGELDRDTRFNLLRMYNATNKSIPFTEYVEKFVRRND